jgi:hypothetical protein
MIAGRAGDGIRRYVRGYRLHLPRHPTHSEALEAAMAVTEADPYLAGLT